MQRCGRQRQPLSLPAAERCGALLLDFNQAVVAQARRDALLAQLRPQSINLAHESQVFENAQVVPQRKSLRHIAELETNCFGMARDIQTQHQRVTSRGSQQAANHAQRGRLSGAIRAQKTVNFTAWNLYADVVHGDLAAEAAGQFAHPNCSTHGVALSCKRTVSGRPDGSASAAASSINTSAK